MGIYPRFLRPIGSSWEYARASCVRLVRAIRGDVASRGPRVGHQGRRPLTNIEETKIVSNCRRGGAFKIEGLKGLTLLEFDEPERTLLTKGP
eukprot:8904693-Pyramimonas_sp.AAC.1